MSLKIFPSNSKNSYHGLRPFWYGQYRVGKKVTTENLRVEIRGIPPESGNAMDQGDKEFERSRAKAQTRLDEIVEVKSARSRRVREVGRERGDALRECQKIVELKTGRKFEDPDLASLSDIYLARMGDRSPCHVAMIRSAFKNLEAFAATQVVKVDDAPPRPCRTLLDISPEMACDFFRQILGEYSYNTAKKFSTVLNAAWKRLAPSGIWSPFDGALVRVMGAKRNERQALREAVHHKPLDREQLQRLYAEAKRQDEMLYRIAVASACTGMRIGDCCCLKWSDIHLKDGYLSPVTIKTGVEVTIPIFDYDPEADGYEPDLGEFRRVLEAALAEDDNGSGYVFPDAAELYKRTVVDKDGKVRSIGPGIVYDRGKVLFARALFSEAVEIEEAKLVTASESEGLSEASPAEVLELIEAAGWGRKRKTRVADIYVRYANGTPYRTIQAETGYSRSTISYDLGSVEKLVGVKIKPRASKAPTVQELLRMTRKERSVGKRAGSEYSWHSLRASFVVLALDNGIPAEKLKAVVGHSTVETTMRYYYHPSQKQKADAVRAYFTARHKRGVVASLRAPKAAAVTLPALGGNRSSGVLDALREALANGSAEEVDALKKILAEMVGENR